MGIDWAAKREAYKRDGVVHIPGLLNDEQFQATLKAWEWSLANPTTHNAPNPSATATSSPSTCHRATTTACTCPTAAC